MINKAVLVVFASLAAFAAANSGADVEWRWIPRHVTVTPNINALPFSKVAETYVPKVRRSGAKTVENCGQGGAGVSTRIVGGDVAEPHTFPHQVALYIDDMYFCGGSIINEEWVLTAAHCMEGAASVEVVAGAHDITTNEPSQVSQFSTDFFVHEDWSSFTLKNDVALIRLPTPFTWTAEISPVCLPAYSSPELQAGDHVTPSGWGMKTDDALGITDLLRRVDVPIDAQSDCDSVYGSIITPDIMCIDTTGGKGTCSGDSGGPLNFFTRGLTYTRGITSFGPSAGCESGYPDGFTRVEHYLAWIETNTGIAIDP